MYVKAVVAAFNHEKALVVAFSVIVKTDCGTDGSFHSTNAGLTASPSPSASPTLTSLLRNSKMADLRAAPHHSPPLSSVSPSHSSASILNSMLASPPRNSLPPPAIQPTSQYTSSQYPAADSSNLIKTARSNLLKRRYNDLLSTTRNLTLQTSNNLGEPLKDLWKFLRALLHNPNYNPKLIAWEDVEQGEFRLHNLQQFYDLWKLVKSSTINYDLWTKTVKLYDDKGFLHSVDGRRCVYKFGVNATDWKPFSHEVIMSPSGEKIQCSMILDIMMLDSPDSHRDTAYVSCVC